jgi:hypothetical protein
MHRSIFVFALIFAAASCHSRHDPGPFARETMGAKGKPFRLQLNPPEGSVYRYSYTTENSVMAAGPGMEVDVDVRLDMVVNYRITRDSNEFELEMSFDKIHIHDRDGDQVTDGDASARSGGSVFMNNLLRKLKSATIYAWVKPTGSLGSMGGGVEKVDEFVDSVYPEAERQKEREFWEEWAEKEIIWKAIEPLYWALPDTSQHTGDHWTGHTTNTEEINFEIENYFHVQSVQAGGALIWSHGELAPKRGQVWFRDKKINGRLSGEEFGLSDVNLSTGMPDRMTDSVGISGLVQIDGRATDIRMVKKIEVWGEKVN